MRWLENCRTLLPHTSAAHGFSCGIDKPEKCARLYEEHQAPKSGVKRPMNRGRLGQQLNPVRTQCSGQIAGLSRQDSWRQDHFSSLGRGMAMLCWAAGHLTRSPQKRQKSEPPPTPPRATISHIVTRRLHVLNCFSQALNTPRKRGIITFPNIVFGKPSKICPCSPPSEGRVLD